MKKFNRILSASLAAIMMLAAATACSEKEQQTTTVDNSNSEYLIAPEMTELTLFSMSDVKIDDTEIWNKIAEMTNIKIKTVSSSANSDADTAMNVMLMSGDIPDLIFSTNMKKFATEFGPDGAFVAIDELISDETPNLKRQLERKEISSYITNADGHAYYMCSVNPDTISAGWFLRQDWLDKLNLKAPTNPEEFYQVMKAFREQDPNGNGIKDEVPYINRFGTVDDLTWIFNATPEWAIDENGKVFYGPAQPEYKVAYENMTKWYAEGLIDTEIYTRGAKSRDKLFGDNVSGIIHDWFASTAQFNDILAEDIPGFKLTAFAPPNEGHIEYTRRAIAVDQGVAIGGTSEKQEYAIKLLDFLFSETGSRLMNFGIEGEHYDLVDDKPIFKDFVVNGDKTAIQILTEIGACSMVYEQDYAYEEQWMTEEAKKGADMYLDNGYLAEAFPTLTYTDEEYDEFNKIMTDVNTFRSERCQQWIFGSDDVSTTFDSYVNELNRLGLEKATQIQQAAYDRYKSE